MKVQIVKMVLRADRLEKQFPVGSVWIHHSGKEYEIVGVANIQNYNPKYRPVVVFRSVVNRNLWTKTPKRFLVTMKRKNT